MLIRKLRDCEEFIAGDRTLLRELLHPDKQPIDLRYSLAHAVVAPGETSTPHALKTSEVYYILSGIGDMHIANQTANETASETADEVQRVQPGDAIYIPPQARQFIHNPGTEPLVFLCIVDPAWRVEDEMIF